jgi:hypothetical protein
VLDGGFPGRDRGVIGITAGGKSKAVAGFPATAIFFVRANNWFLEDHRIETGFQGCGFSDVWMFRFFRMFGSLVFLGCLDAWFLKDRMLVSQRIGCLVGFFRILDFRFLDVGCSVGFAGYWLGSSFGFRGLDCFRLLIQRCKRRGEIGNLFDKREDMPDESDECPTNGCGRRGSVRGY